MKPFSHIITSVETIECDNYKIKIIRRPRRRSFRLEVHNDDDIRLVASKTAKLKDLLTFALQNKEWIEKKTLAFTEQNKKFPKKLYQQGERFLFLGKERLLKFTSHNRTRFKVEFDSNFITIFVPTFKWNEFMLTDPQPWARAILIKALKDEAKMVLLDRTEFWVKKMQASNFKKLKFKMTKSRWGSCSTKGNVNLNWGLIIAPLDVIDAVIVHELVHLRIQNHSRQYWNQVYSWLPDYKIRHRWLKDHNSEFKFFFEGR